MYEYTHSEIAAAVDGLLRMVRVLTEDSELVHAALASYLAGADFADALIAGSNAAQGCTNTVTFDRKAVRKISQLVAIEAALGRT